MGAKLPAFPEAEFQIGDLWITKKQLQAAILKRFPDLAERSCISRRPDGSGGIAKKYAWHSVIEDVNKGGYADIIVADLCDLDELCDNITTL